MTANGIHFRAAGILGIVLATAAWTCLEAAPPRVADNDSTQSPGNQQEPGGNQRQFGRSIAIGQSSAQSIAGGGGAGQTRTSRSISVNENGQGVTIEESSDAGITVTITENVDGREQKTVVQAANAAELKKKNPKAHRLYQKHAGMARAAAGGGAAGGAGPGAVGPGGDAKQLLRDQLRKMIEENADNPQIQSMLQRALRDLDR